MTSRMTAKNTPTVEDVDEGEYCNSYGTIENRARGNNNVDCKSDKESKGGVTLLQRW